MDAKQIEIACPCCKSRLLVDVRTGKLLRTLRPEELDATGKPVVGERDWDQALGKVRERSDQGESKLDSALDRERKRSADLDDLFRKAREKLRDPDDELPPPKPRKP
jgi:hypothetical protein